MFFLIFNVMGDWWDLWVAVWECSKSFLPVKLVRHEFLFFDERIRSFFYFHHKIRYTAIRFHPDENMDMVCIAVKCEGFLPFVFDDAGYVFEQLIFPGRVYKGLAVLDRKYDLNVDLWIRISHNNRYLTPPGSCWWGNWSLCWAIRLNSTPDGVV